jgi:uroporphyrinogen decarboxylase
MVRNPARFEVQADGTIFQAGGSQMPPSSYVFDQPHGGQPLNLSDELPKLDLKQFRQDLAARAVTDERIIAVRDLCRRVREASDRAVFLNEGSLPPPICIHGHGGLAVFPILCITEPDYVHELHEIATEYSLRNVRALLPEVKDYVDVIMMASDDWGTQRSTMASPKVYRDLFLPYRRRINDEVHRLAPGVKTFLHSCGAIYNIIDYVVESGFDVLNPVQWTAGGRSFRDWKDRARGRIALWGGGVNSQVTLPLGSVEDVEREAAEVVSYLGQDSGYVFCNIHNILAEIDPHKVMAMYRAAEMAAVATA